MRICLSVFLIVVLSACAAPAAVVPAEKSETAAAKSEGANTATEREINPAYPRVAVNADRALGDPKAALAIVEFGDYQCPYCRAFHASTFRELRTKYVDTGKVRYFYKDFPLRSHVHAFPASLVAYCAGEQGRFWEMQDHLYAKQIRLGPPLYAELVTLFKLDAAKIDACRTSQAARSAVLRDFEDGRRIRISGTPSFVIGHIEGDRVVVERMAAGAPSLESFAEVIEMLSR